MAQGIPDGEDWQSWVRAWMETKLLGVQLGVFLLIWGLFTRLGKFD